jgi:DNA polymerase-3 subunit delta'
LSADKPGFPTPIPQTRIGKLVPETTLSWQNLLGQERVKEMLGTAFAAGTLGHAYLFSGEEGVGKFEAAFELALALLCTGGAGAPCRTCASCQKALRNAHPDFHVIVPVALDKEHKASDGKLSPAGWDFLSQNVRERIEAPYRRPSHAGVPAIPVEWIKEVNHAILRGAVEGSRTVAIIAGVDLMNKESANAMLKTLEEPPKNTLIILTTNMPQSILPTIASRCQVVRFGLVPVEHIKEALHQAAGMAEPGAEIERAAQYAMGSVSRALSLLGSDQTESLAEARGFLNACCAGDWPAVSQRIDTLSRADGYEAHTRLFMNLLYLVRNGILRNEGRSSTYIDESDGVAAASLPPDVRRVERLCSACQDALSALSSNGNCGIIYVNFAITVMEICDVEKQQAG